MQDFIVSITSYGPRFKHLPLILRNVLKQTLLPQKIIINIDENEKVDFDDYLNLLPGNLQIEVNYVENLGPGKKLIPTLERYPEVPIITIDDDLNFRPDLFYDLWQSHLLNPESIIATRSHVPLELPCGYLAPYETWDFDSFSTNSPILSLVTAGSGALFPPYALDQGVLDTDKYKDLSFSTDDIWYWFHAILKGTKIVRISGHNELAYIRNSQETTLYWDGNAELFNNLNIQLTALEVGAFRCQSNCHPKTVQDLLREVCMNIDRDKSLRNSIIPLTVTMRNLDRYLLFRRLSSLEKVNNDFVALKNSNLKLLKQFIRNIFTI